MSTLHDGCVEEAAAATAPFEITLTTARCWSRATNGVYLDIDDPTGGIEALHAQLSALESPAWARAGFRPHVTLVHGRTVDPDLAEPAWAALCDVTFGWTVQLSTLDVIELDEATGWRCGCCDVPARAAPYSHSRGRRPRITSASARTTFPTARSIVLLSGDPARSELIATKHLRDGACSPATVDSTPSTLDCRAARPCLCGRAGWAHRR